MVAAERYQQQNHHFTHHYSLEYHLETCVEFAIKFWKRVSNSRCVAGPGQRKANLSQICTLQRFPDGPDGRFAEAAATGSLRGEFAPPSPLQDADLCNLFRELVPFPTHSHHGTPWLHHVSSCVLFLVAGLHSLAHVRNVKTCERHCLSTASSLIRPGASNSQMRLDATCCAVFASVVPLPAFPASHHLKTADQQEGEGAGAASKEDALNVSTSAPAETTSQSDDGDRSGVGGGGDAESSARSGPVGESGPTTGDATASSRSDGEDVVSSASVASVAADDEENDDRSGVAKHAPASPPASAPDFPAADEASSGPPDASEDNASPAQQPLDAGVACVPVSRNRGMANSSVTKP